MNCRIYTLALLFALLTSGCSRISDSDLNRMFTSKKEAFEKLREMMAAQAHVETITDSVVVTNVGFFSPRSDPDRLASAGLSQNRLRDYIALFRDLGLADGIARDARGIWFRAQPPSIWNGDSTKGYVFSTADLKPITSNLDTYMPPPSVRDRSGGYTVFERLAGHWYLYKQVN